MLESSTLPVQRQPAPTPEPIAPPRSLRPLFLFLLWGDFAFIFFESIFGRFMPLYLKQLDASNTLIGVMTGTITGILNVLFLPNISQWSDRFRSRWGRRRPFLLVMAPCTTLSLICVGCAPEIVRSLHLPATASSGIASGSVLLFVLCFFTVLYHFCNMVLIGAYNWLLRDVVPSEIMPQFLSWFRVVGTTASVLFLWFVFPVMLDHRVAVFVSIGLFTLVSFVFMCWRVEEGPYPPPEPRRGGLQVVRDFAAYFRECLSISLYRNYILVNMLVMIGATSAASFFTLYARQTLDLSMDDMGRIWAASALVNALLCVPVGQLCQKYTSMYVTFVSLVLILIVSVSAYGWTGSRIGWFAYSIIFMIPWVGWGLGSLALCMHLFPEAKFGQFFSALNVFGCGGLILGNYLIGRFMDFNGSQYRYVFLWSALFYLLALIPMYRVRAEWRRHGGPKHYIAPVLTK